MADKSRFNMVGYCGATISGGWWGALVIDISGIRTADLMPALYHHAQDRQVGVITETSKKDGKLTASGYFLDTQYGRQCKSLLDQDFPIQASIGVWASAVEEVKAGSKAKVNGREIAGPATIWRTSFVREISFCSLGADSETSVSIAASAGLPGGGADFWAHVETFQAEGMSRGGAVTEAVRRHPESHKEWLEDVRSKSRKAPRGGIQQGPAQQAFMSAVQAYAERHQCSRAQAMTAIVREQKGLHQAMLDEIRGGK